MISRTESQKILVETSDENIDIEPLPFVLRSSLRSLVPLQIAPKKGQICVDPHFKIIKTDEG
jgi:hypothetical protein